MQWLAQEKSKLLVEERRDSIRVHAELCFEFREQNVDVVHINLE